MRDLNGEVIVNLGCWRFGPVILQSIALIGHGKSKACWLTWRPAHMEREVVMCINMTTTKDNAGNNRKTNVACSQM
eukprot:3357249-Amphidinium_carterae.2